MWIKASDADRLLQALAINLFLIVGIWKLFQKDMLLGPAGDWMYSKLGEYRSKPVFTCPSCMASCWGTVFFFCSRLYELLPWWTWPLHCITLCGVATFAMFFDNLQNLDNE
jgi:hypothetical protein